MMVCKYSSFNFDPSLLASVRAVVILFEISLPFISVSSTASSASSMLRSISSAGTVARCFFQRVLRTDLSGLAY
jgi:hypothetical protein